MRILQYDNECENILTTVAENHGVDKEKLWEMFLEIMRRNFLDDISDIATENEEELKGE